MRYWSVQAPINRDCWVVLVVEYRPNADGGYDGFYLSPTGYWVSYAPGDVIQPALELSGQLVHTLRFAGVKLDRDALGHELVNIIEGAARR